MFIFNKIKQSFLLFGDLVLLFLSLYITLSLRYSQLHISNNWQEHFLPFAFIYFIWVLIFYSQNLYNLNLVKNNFGFFKILFESFIINFIITAFFFYFTPFFGIAPKTNLFLNIIIAGMLITSWRGFYNIFTAKYSFKNRIAFLGYSKEVEEMIKAFKNEPQLGYETVCIVQDEDIPNLNHDIKQIKTKNLKQAITELNIKTIVTHYTQSIDQETTNELYKLIFSNITFVNFLKLYEEVTGKLPTGALSHGWFLENLEESEKRLYDRLKIIIDYVLAIFIGAIFLVVLIPISLLILITSGKPIFYSQTRIGQKGKKFSIHKFRTMVRDAEADGIKRTTNNDERITRFGNFLRKTRIDELPQIINVLKGDMSFLGPRPERPQFVEELTDKMPFYPIRHLVKPGLTGWAQINYPYAGTITENLKKLQYDIYYIKNRSLLLDATIILKTFNIILRFKGR